MNRLSLEESRGTSSTEPKLNEADRCESKTYLKAKGRDVEKYH